MRRYFQGWMELFCTIHSMNYWIIMNCSLLLSNTGAPSGPHEHNRRVSPLQLWDSLPLTSAKGCKEIGDSFQHYEEAHQRPCHPESTCLGLRSSLTHSLTSNVTSGKLLHLSLWLSFYLYKITTTTIPTFQVIFRMKWVQICKTPSNCKHILTVCEINANVKPEIKPKEMHF